MVIYASIQSYTAHNPIYYCVKHTFAFIEPAKNEESEAEAGRDGGLGKAIGRYWERNSERAKVREKIHERSRIRLREQETNRERKHERAREIERESASATGNRMEAGKCKKHFRFSI